MERDTCKGQANNEKILHEAETGTVSNLGIKHTLTRNTWSFILQKHMEVLAPCVVYSSAT